MRRLPPGQPSAGRIQRSGRGPPWPKAAAAAALREQIEGVLGYTPKGVIAFAIGVASIAHGKVCNGTHDAGNN